MLPHPAPTLYSHPRPTYIDPAPCGAPWRRRRDLLQVPIADVLYLRSKDSTLAHSAAAGQDGSRVVAHRPLSDEPRSVRDYVASDEFNRSNALDYALHAAASAELDRRWRANKAELDRNLAAYRAMLARAAAACSDVQARMYGANQSYVGLPAGLCY